MIKINISDIQQRIADIYFRLTFWPWFNIWYIWYIWNVYSMKIINEMLEWKLSDEN